MRNLITLLMIVCCALLSKGDDNIHVIKHHSKIYYLGNDSIGWCTFYDDGSLIGCVTDIRHGHYKTICPGDCDDLVYEYQGQACEYSRTDSTLIYIISVLYWVDDLGGDVICDVYKTTYNKLIRDIYKDIYTYIIKDLNISSCNVVVNENFKHINRDKFCSLLTDSENAIELGLLRTNHERLQKKHNQDDMTNLQQNVPKGSSYVLNFSDIEDNMVVAELLSKDNSIVSSYLVLLDKKGEAKEIKRL